MKKQYTFLVLLLLFFSSSLSLLAQTTPPNPNPPPPGLPIDGFLGLAGLLALTYGAYKKINNPKN